MIASIATSTVNCSATRGCLGLPASATSPKSAIVSSCLSAKWRWLPSPSSGFQCLRMSLCSLSIRTCHCRDWLGHQETKTHGLCNQGAWLDPPGSLCDTDCRELATLSVASFWGSNYSRWLGGTHVGSQRGHHERIQPSRRTTFFSSLAGNAFSAFACGIALLALLCGHAVRDGPCQSSQAFPDVDSVMTDGSSYESSEAGDTT